MTPTRRRPPDAIAVLHPGDMGAALGAILCSRGYRVLAWTAGRSGATRQRAASAGLVGCSSLEELAREAAVVFSLVPPEAAAAVARSYAEVVAPGRRPLFADLNSIAPEVAREIGRALAARGIDFVDGAIHGQARRLAADAVLYLCGAEAPRVSALLGSALATRLLGPEVGAASRLKLLLSCISKSLVALCLEVGSAARDTRAWPEFWEALRHFYPELAAATERMGPTLPRHARRRIDEMAQAERLFEALGRDAGFASASRRFLARVADAALAPMGPDRDGWDLPRMIEALRVPGATHMEDLPR